MKKKIVLWAGLFLAGLSLALNAQEVDLSIDHPGEVQAGEAFEVSVTIQKGALRDYSRFSQDLPAGLTATNISSPNADFSFDNQRIRIIWLKLPEDAEIKVSYNVMVDSRLKGTFALGGVFAYVVDEERKFLNFDEAKEVHIIPDPDMDPEKLVDIKDFKAGAVAPVAAAATVQSEVFAMAVRQAPLLESTGAYLVKLLVKNPDGSKYAKIEESIPSGYIFESVDSHDGIESFSSSTVKFIWMKLPDESEFEVSYRLVPKRDETQGEMVIDGKLTYSAGNENKVEPVKQMEVDLAALSVAEKKELLQSGKVPAGVAAASSVKPVPEQAEPPKRTEPEPVQEKPAPDPSVPAGASAALIMNTPVLGTGSGVYYRVQLAAFSKPVDGKSMYRQAGIDEEVFVEREEGYYKYTAGSFRSYEQALSYRNRVNRLSSIEGAFVVKYRDGKREAMGAAR